MADSGTPALLVGVVCEIGVVAIYVMVQSTVTTASLIVATVALVVNFAAWASRPTQLGRYR